jgi:thiamine-phosphate pyrophosphorylase
MAEVRHPCRLYFEFTAQPSAKLEAQLARALDSTDAASVLLCVDGAVADENHLGHLVDLVQSRGRACLVHDDIGLAERLGADGIHIPPDPALYAESRKRLGESASIGVGCGLSRHDAMLLAELGADYVAFGPAASSDIDGIDQCAELIAWWSEIFVVPCIAWHVAGPKEARRLAALGADFVALPAAIWRHDDAEARIAEIDRAIRQARRAA